jgi:hypothetical protein
MISMAFRVVVLVVVVVVVSGRWSPPSFIGDLILDMISYIRWVFNSFDSLERCRTKEDVVLTIGIQRNAV